MEQSINAKKQEETMKAKLRKRILSFVLCMVMVLSSGTAAQADDTKLNTGVSDAIQTSQEIQSEAVDSLKNTDLSEMKEVSTEEVPTEEVPIEEAPTEDSKDVAEEPEAQPPANNEAKTEWSQQVGDATVKVIADAGALPQDAVLYANQIIDEKEVEEIEKIVEEKSIEEQVVAEKMVAYDIKFMAGDSEVQPSSPVQVLVDTPEIENGKNASVIHVAENDETEDMKGTVDNEGNVVFEAPHFSRYVIIQEGGKEVKVTIEHDDTAGKKIYSDDKVTLPVGGKINDYAKATNWDVSSVVIGDKTYTKEDDYSEIKVTKDTNIIVNYTPKKTTVSGATTLYDYTVMVQGENGKQLSINALENYKNPNSQQRLTAGTTAQNFYDYKSTWKPADSSYNANEWTGNPGYGQKTAVVKGLLKGLDDKGEVVFNYEEPGFFEDDDLVRTVEGEKRYLRQVYKNYKLSFEQTGDSYTLRAVNNSNGDEVAKSGTDFFPLESEKKSYEQSQTNKNFFFGMRYDVTFKIGDYVGSLDYTFTGDDDLWVVLDGKQVVIDLGGIHNAAAESVDLWEYIGAAETLTPEKKQEEHTLTILYMERGAGQSNCQMNFTLPSASISEVTEVPMTNLLLNKVNSKNGPLVGAKFKLTNDATGESFTAESISTGAVQFTKLREGQYTLRETQAPSGYIPTVDEWKVKVTLDSEGKAVATVYLIDGETEAKVDPEQGGIYKVVNVTEQELIDSTMDYNKTATVKNWDERIYDINITASSKITKTLTEEKDALDTTKIYYGSTSVYGNSSGQRYANQPIVYFENSWKILENSKWISINDSDSRDIYTFDSRLTGLKEATTAFVSSAAASPDSIIGVTAFNTTNKVVSPLAKVGSDRTGLVETIDSVFADGGTAPSEGLKSAYTSLANGKRENVPQYIILFTDGEPTGGGNTWNDAEAMNTKLWADKLKQEGIIVYTVGLGLTDKTKGWLDGSMEIPYNGANISGIASEDCAFTVENLGDLKAIFKKNQETVTENIDIIDAQIKDVIDPRFVILDDEDVPITKDYPGIKNGITLENGGTVYYDQITGEQYIVWNKQKIPNGKFGHKWNKTITVKAREDFIGGNNIATNVSPDSSISMGYGTAVLPQPKVNVKAQLDVSNQDVTIYKGDTIPTDKEILNSLFTTKYIGYYGVTAENFKLSWYTDKTCSGEGISTDALKVAKPDSDISYYLKVTYDAGIPTAESNKNTTQGGNVYIAGEQDHIVEAVNNGKQNGEDSNDFVNQKGKPYGVYKIKLVSGAIEITKTLGKAAETDKTFTFVIKKDAEQQPFKEVQITVLKGETEATLLNDELKNLPRGKYIITEAVDIDYSLQNVEVKTPDTNCDNSRTQESATFELGQQNNGNVIKNYIYNKQDGGTLGSVTFTNAAVIRNWTIVKRSTSSDSMFLEGAEFSLSPREDMDLLSKPTYYGRSDSNGEVKWFTDKKHTIAIETANLELGSYIFKEVKAPVGYELSSKSWYLKIGEDGLFDITLAGKEPEHGSQTINGTTVVRFYFDNTPVYDLPSAGGTGIYWYMIGGMLLMFAAALILYKTRCKDVLKN